MKKLILFLFLLSGCADNATTSFEPDAAFGIIVSLDFEGDSLHALDGFNWSGAPPSPHLTLSDSTWPGGGQHSLMLKTDSSSFESASYLYRFDSVYSRRKFVFTCWARAEGVQRNVVGMHIQNGEPYAGTDVAPTPAWTKFTVEQITAVKPGDVVELYLQQTWLDSVIFVNRITQVDNLVLSSEPL